MSVETAENVSIGLATVMTNRLRDTRPRFQAEELATPGSLAVWLGQMADQGYHLVNVTSITQTNHFNKDVCAVVWALVERDAPA